MNRLSPAIRTFAAIVGTVFLVASVPNLTIAETVDLFTGFQSKSRDPVEIDAAKLEITEEGDQRVSVFSGNVVVRRGETVLRAKTIQVFSDTNGKGPKGQAFSRIVASGNVDIKSGPQSAKGAKVVVDMGKQTITMSGGVVLSQGANVISGERLVVDLVSGSARVEETAGQRIRGVFTPNSASIPGQ